MRDGDWDKYQVTHLAVKQVRDEVLNEGCGRSWGEVEERHWGGV